MNQKPNIVIITIDECKASAMSPYGNKFTMTPAAERASRMGVTFENSFTCHPKCVPSRACLMSGRYAHTGGHRTLPGFELRKDEINLADILKSNGYVTGLFGKNHTMEEDYKEECFDEYTTIFNRGNIKRNKKTEMDFEHPLFRAFYRGNWDNTFSSLPNDYYDIEDSVKFINKHKENPFFLLMNLTFPHPSYYEMEPYFKLIKEKGISLPKKHSIEMSSETLRQYRDAYDLEMLTDQEWEKVVLSYYSMVSYIDNCVGKIYDVLEQNGLIQNSIVVYTSDHGDFAGEHGCVEKFDTFFYDCLMKIPLFIQYPNKIKAGTRMDSMVENVDILPTILELAGIDIPESVHGKSLVPYLLGEVDEHKTEVFCEGGVEDYAIRRAPHYDSPECERMWPTYYRKQKTLIDYPRSMQRSKAVRTKEWKLIYRQDGSKELYNLLIDPDEMQNVVEDTINKEIIYHLMEKLLQWMIRTETDSPKIENLYG